MISGIGWVSEVIENRRGIDLLVRSRRLRGWQGPIVADHPGGGPSPNAIQALLFVVGKKYQAEKVQARPGGGGPRSGQERPPYEIPAEITPPARPGGVDRRARRHLRGSSALGRGSEVSREGGSAGVRPRPSYQGDLRAAAARDQLRRNHRLEVNLVVLVPGAGQASTLPSNATAN